MSGLPPDNRLALPATERHLSEVSNEFAWRAADSQELEHQIGSIGGAGRRRGFVGEKSGKDGEVLTDFAHGLIVAAALESSAAAQARAKTGGRSVVVDENVLQMAGDTLADTVSNTAAMLGLLLRSLDDHTSERPGPHAILTAHPFGPEAAPTI